jgi:hypothetical protein
MIAAAALLLAAAPALAPASQSPVELFKAACTGGSVSLSKESAAPVDYARLPYGARDALGETLVAPGQPLPGPAKRDEFPGPIFTIGPNQALFLVAPAADAQAKGQFAHACAVVWKGEHYAEGRAALLPNGPEAIGGLETPSSNPLGIASVGIVSGGLYLSVTTLRGWTVLKAIPAADASSKGAN